MAGPGAGFQAGLLAATALMCLAVATIYTLWVPPGSVGVGAGEALTVPGLNPSPGRAAHTGHTARTDSAGHTDYAQLQHTHHELGIAIAPDTDRLAPAPTHALANADAAAADGGAPGGVAARPRPRPSETPAAPPQGKPSTPRVVVVTEVAEPEPFEAYFAGLLHASWQLQRDIAAVSRTPAGIAAGRAAGAAAIQLASPAEQPIHSVDLFAFCEVGACTNMPPGCREVEYGGDTPYPDPAGGACWYSFLPDDYVAQSVARSRGKQGGRFTGEIFLTSLVFLTLEPALHSLKGYDYALRTDTDATLGHGVFQWVPAHAAFGWGWMGEPRTAYKWLEEAAARLKLEHHEVHAMQSTFYLEQKLIAPFADALVNLTGHFISEEFTPKRCAEKRGSARWLATEWNASNPCSWPHWHKGVGTLYAQNIAVNGILPKYGVAPEQAMVTERLDYSIGAPPPYDFSFPFDKVIQVHLVNCRFQEQCRKMSKLHADYTKARGETAGEPEGEAKGAARGNRSRSRSYTIAAGSAVCAAATAEYAQFSTATPASLQALQPVPPNGWPQYGQYTSARFFAQVCVPAS